MYCQLCEIMANLFTCCRCRCRCRSRRRSQSDQPETPKDCKRDYKNISAEICMMHWIEQPSSQDKCNLGGGEGVGGWGWVWPWPKRYLDGQLNENMLKTTFKPQQQQQPNAEQGTTNAEAPWHLMRWSWWWPSLWFSWNPKLASNSLTLRIRFPFSSQLWKCLEKKN